MRKSYLAGLAALAALAVACSGGNTKDNPGAKTVPQNSATATDEATTTAAAGRDPKPSDFTLTVKVTKKDCFGSAGCSIEYHIVPKVASGINEDNEYTVTYEVRGVQDAPQVGSFTIQGGKYVANSDESASTTSSRAKLTAKVTDVEKTG